MRLLLALLAALVVAGCGDAPASVPKRTELQKQQLSERIERSPPITVEHGTRYGQLLILNIPVGGTVKYTETQRCFVWRDSEYKNTSMQCPADAGDLNLTSPEMLSDR